MVVGQPEATASATTGIPPGDRVCSGNSTGPSENTEPIDSTEPADSTNFGNSAGLGDSTGFGDGADRVFHALADSTRRDILSRVIRSAQSVSELARAYPMSFAAVQKHVAVLERAGLVSKVRRGREQLVHGEVSALCRVARLLDTYEEMWHYRADRIADILQEDDEPPAEPEETGPATTGPASTGPASTGPASTGPAPTGPAPTGTASTRTAPTTSTTRAETVEPAIDSEQ